MLDLHSKKKFIFIGGLIVIGATLTFFLSRKLGKEEVKKDTPSILWGQALDKINQTWSGDFSLRDEHLLKNCPHLEMGDEDAKKVSNILKACRPELFSCFYKDRKLTLKNKSQYFSLRVIVDEERDNSSAIPITLKLGQSQKKFELTRFCRQKELPQGAYWGSKSSEKQSRLWHTSGIRYFIDKTLVRNLEVRSWLLKKGIKDEEQSKRLFAEYKSMTGAQLFHPSGNLTPNLMKEFCYDRGQEVLSSKVKAAITFHHGRRQEEFIKRDPPSFNTSPHPFGPRFQDSPQYKAEKKVKVKRDEGCRKIFSKECVEDNYSLNKSWGMGWAGISEVLGGPAEYVVNLEFPRKNLHPSSYYHKLASNVHQAGVRVFWTGRGHRRIDFNFFTSPFFEKGEDHFNVGFRCMKKVFNDSGV